MANTKEIQDRIKSINDTLKITNAMYMISSSKLKKSKKMLSDTEPYFFTLQSEMSRILRHIPDISSIYFKTNEDKDAADKKVGYIVITADKGLAGSYNHNVLKIAQEQLEKNPNHSLFVLGELGRHYFEQRGIVDIITESKNILTEFICILIGGRLGHCIFYQPEYFLTQWDHFIEMLIPILQLERQSDLLAKLIQVLCILIRSIGKDCTHLQGTSQEYAGLDGG